MAGNSIAQGVAYRDQLIRGTQLADDAITGDVGEYIFSTIPTASGVSLTTATAANVTSIRLTPGDWDVDWQANFNPGATTSVTQLNASISFTTNTLGTQPAQTFGVNTSAGPEGLTLINQAAAVPAAVVGVSSSTVRVKVDPRDCYANGYVTLYFVAQASFTISTMAVFGTIRARRVR